MLPFTKWVEAQKYDEGSRGLMKGLRRTVSQFAPYLGKTLGDGNVADATSKSELQNNMRQAAQQANEINRQNPGGVTVYHAIILGRGDRTVEDRLRFLTSKKAGEQQSVSVGALKNSLWDFNLVLVGTAKKLTYYWPTDIHTKPVPGNPRIKVPLNIHRPSDFRPYDEALIDLKDVTWHTMFVNTNNPEAIKFAGGAGGMENIRRLAKIYNLRIKTPDEASQEEHSPLVYRYQIQMQIDKLTKYNNYLHQQILQITSSIQSNEDHPPKVKDVCRKIQDHIQVVDINHGHLVKYPAKRAEAMEQTFTWMKSIFQKLHDYLQTGRLDFHDENQ